MASPAAATGCYPNVPILTKPMSNSSISHRSSSVKPSMRSSISRSTLVGYDAELEPKTDFMYGTTNNAKEFGWFDHLLAVCCISRRPKFGSQMTASVDLLERNNREIHLASPWVLPVYVLSNERDDHRHLIPREAKCTIDTGNLQGNIISRAFLVDVLGYSEVDFQKLTTEEENGGTGITGHKLIPDGAINLTWYHSNSTRVFRDMRFLISEHPMYDLIIGAHSIRENNILDVPNLAHGPGISLSNSRLVDGPNYKHLEELEKEMNTLKEDRDKFQLNGWKKHTKDKGKKNELVAPYTKKFEDKHKEFQDECRKEYEILIQAEKHDEKRKALQKECNSWLSEEEKPKKD